MDLSRLTPGQRQSVEHLHGPLLMCAGAGSGKTFTLTQRIAYALDPASGSGIEDIDSILAITFTEKAAAEIRSRVRSTLRAEGMAEQALKADGAWISTIHGMCSRILHAHAFELGLDPTFSVLDSVQEAELRVRALEAVLEQNASREDDRYAPLFSEYGANDGSDNSVGLMVSRIISEAASLTDGLDAISLGPTPASPTTSARLLAMLYSDIAEIGTPKQQEVAQMAAGDVQTYLIAGSTDWESFVPVLEKLGRPAASGAAKEAVIEVQQLLDKTFSDLNLARSYGLTQLLLELARGVEREYEVLKMDADKVDTDGLLRLTLKAFSEHPAIASRYQQQFKLVMVDEFQDTNQLQIDMIGQIAGDNNSHLCTVGDSQQSIYRFRGADVNVYASHKRTMRTAEVQALDIELADNFRSHTDILSFVRAVCGQGDYFSEPFLDLHAKRDEAQVVARGSHYKSKDPRIDVVLTRYARGTSIDEAKRVEAAALATRFAELRDAGHEARDMVVLLGSMTRAGVYASALRDVGFDCLIAGGSGFFEAQEVKLVGRLLAMLANPADSESLFAVLSSEMLALSADDFLDLTTAWQEPAIKSQEPSMNSQAPYVESQEIGMLSQELPVTSQALEAEPQTFDTNPQDSCAKPKKRALGPAFLDRRKRARSPRVDFVMDVFERAWTTLGVKAPSSVVTDVLVDSGWLSRLESQGASGQAIAGNVVKAVRIIEGLESEVGFDLSQVARKFAKLSNDRERPGALMVEGLNAVRIMTVHASKGLEFPLVAVGDCYAVSEKDTQLLMLPDRGHLHLSLKPLRSATASPVSSKYRYAAEDDQALADASTPAEFRAVMLRRLSREALEEKRRLFYVAATRASEALYIAMTASSTYAPIQNDIREGLFGEDDFPVDTHSVVYGGSEPLHFAYQDAPAIIAQEEEAQAAVLVAEDAQSGEGVAAKVDGGMQLAGHEGAWLELPQLTARERLDVLLPNRDTGLFSYSSIAKHKEDEAAEDVEETASRKGASFEEVFVADADKATDFGSALHRLAQIAALFSVETARARFDGVAATYTIKDHVRLHAALDRWLGSNVCARAFTYERHLPEVPFCVAVGEGFLEGEIDLLCSDAERTHAFIVDYKTGGSATETAAALHEKHLLQAQCYAYATLRQGFKSVEFAFVRVERDDPSASDTLQVVSYQFAQADIPELESVIKARTEKSHK